MHIQKQHIFHSLHVYTAVIEKILLHLKPVATLFSEIIIFKSW